MMNQIRLTRWTVIVGIAIVAVLLLAWQISLAPALGQNIPDNATSVFGDAIASDADRDYSCTGGATGQCSVVYITSGLNVIESFETCGSSSCVVKVEYRW